VKELRLAKGYVVLVDDQDYERVIGHRWYAEIRTRRDGSVKVYARRKVQTPGISSTWQSLHRFILNAPDGMQVDHINGKGLDNRRSNLRLCSHAENQHNRRPQTGGTSAFKGVRWHKAAAKWVASISINGESKHLGSFSSEQDAAKAYDLAAAANFGEYARHNNLAGV